MLERLLRLIYPARCPFCGRLTGDVTRPCERCLAEIPFIRPPVCPRCGAQVKECSCRGRGAGVTGSCGVVLYRGVGKRAAQRLKFRGDRGAIQLAANYLAAAVQRDFAGCAFSAVTFVPMHRKDRRRRGYNQSELLARALGERLSLPVEPMLKKVRHTPHQRELPAKERRVNLSGAFAPAKEHAPETVLLVDDIRTTGATLAECAKVLREMGAKRVYTACFALGAGNFHKKGKRNYE